MPTAIVVLAEGFEEIEAITVIDVLRRAKVEVTVAGLDATRVTGARGITIEADALLIDTPDTPDAFILPGGIPGSNRLAESELVKARAIKNMTENRIVGAICAAPALALGAFGLLENRQATCYPGYEESFPESAEYLDEVVVVDNNLVTSQGVGTALYFSLALVDMLINEETADTLAEGMLVS